MACVGATTVAHASDHVPPHAESAQLQQDTVHFVLVIRKIILMTTGILLPEMFNMGCYYCYIDNTKNVPSDSFFFHICTSYLSGSVEYNIVVMY